MAFKVGDKVIDSYEHVLTIVKETKLYWILDTGSKVRKCDNRFVGCDIWHFNDIHEWTNEEEVEIKAKKHRRIMLKRIVHFFNSSNYTDTLSNEEIEKIYAVVRKVNTDGSQESVLQ
jgi:DNA-directed RNA polymerase alpha subunit